MEIFQRGWKHQPDSYAGFGLVLSWFFPVRLKSKTRGECPSVALASAGVERDACLSSSIGKECQCGKPSANLRLPWPSMWNFLRTLLDWVEASARANVRLPVVWRSGGCCSASFAAGPFEMVAFYLLHQKHNIYNTWYGISHSMFRSVLTGQLMLANPCCSGLQPTLVISGWCLLDI
jgi:hypothetical protein